MREAKREYEGGVEGWVGRVRKSEVGNKKVRKPSWYRKSWIW